MKKPKYVSGSFYDHRVAIEDKRNIHIVNDYHLSLEDMSDVIIQIANYCIDEGFIDRRVKPKIFIMNI